MNPPMLATIRRLVIELGGPNWKSYALSFFFMGLIAASTAMTAYVMRDVINQVFISRDEVAIWWIAGLVIVIYAVKGLATFAQQATLNRIGNRIVQVIVYNTPR